MEFTNISLAGGEVRINFCVVKKEYWNHSQNQDQDSLYLKFYFDTLNGKGFTYRDKSVKASGNGTYGLKISLSTGKISKLEQTELHHNGECGILNRYDRDMSYGTYSYNNDASTTCKKQLDPIIRNWLESYDVSSLLKKCRKEFIEATLEQKETEFKKLLEEAEELKIKIESLKIYNTIG